MQSTVVNRWYLTTLQVSQVIAASRVSVFWDGAQQIQCVMTAWHSENCQFKLNAHGSP